MVNTNYVYNYKKVDKVKDIKYSGIHPFEKKKLIKRMNIEIDNFNKYWAEKIPPMINDTINSYAGENRVSNIMKFMKKNNYPEMTEKDLANALEANNVVFTQDEARKIFNQLSGSSRNEFQLFINKITKGSPNERLYEKIEKEGGKKVFKGGKIGAFNDFSKALEEELGITTDDNGRMKSLKPTPSMVQSITNKVEALLEKKLKGIKRGEKKKLEIF